MSQTNKKIQKQIVEQFSKSLNELVRPKHLKMIKNEIEETSDEKFYILYKFKGIKSFRILFSKVVKYVFESKFSKSKDLIIVFGNISKVIDLKYPNIKTR